MRTGADAGEGRSPATTGLGVVLAGAVLVGLGLGSHPLLDPNEAKHALIAAEMHDSGAWLRPVLNGEAYHHKPGLFYALVGIAYRLFGVGELGARAVPALATCGTLLVTYLFAARRGVAVGLLAAVLLAAVVPFVQLGRFASLDALFTFALTSALFAAAARVEEPGPTVLPWSSFALVALAVLIKGPVAFILLGPLVPLIAIDGGIDGRRILAGAVLCVLLIALWAVPTYVASPEYLSEFLLRHNFERYFTPEEKFHQQPLYYFVPVLAAALLPWSVLIPRVLRAAVGVGRSDRLLAAFAVWVFVFFSLSAGKLATYIAPIVPALAVLTARWLASHGDDVAFTSAPELAAGAAILSCLAPAAAAGAIWLAPSLLPIAAALLPLSLFAAAALVAYRARASASRVALLACAGCLTSTLLLDLLGGRAIATLTSDYDLATRARALGRPDRMVVYRVRPFSFLFYTRWRAAYKVSDDEYRAALKDPGTWLLLTKEKRLDALRDVVPGLRYAIVARNTRHLLLAPGSEHRQ